MGRSTRASVTRAPRQVAPVTTTTSEAARKFNEHADRVPAGSAAETFFRAKAAATLRAAARQTKR